MAEWLAIDNDDDFSDPFDSDEGFSDQSEARHFDTSPKQRWQRAAIGGNLQELIKAREDGKILIDELLDGNWTALMYAASFSQPEIAKYLLENGADVQYIYNSSTPLLFACLSTSISLISNYATVKLLLDHKSEVNFSDSYGQTALMKAIETGKNYVASMLIPLSNLEKKDRQGKTAVFYAVEYDREEILERLIDAGVDLKIVDNHQTSLKSLAISKNYKPVIDILKDLLKDDEVLKVNYLMIYKNKIIWQHMFPNILDHSPAYFYDVVNHLCEIYCENLVPLFEENKIGLLTFLTMSDDDLQNINVIFPYQRKLILSSVYKFHLYHWKANLLSNIAINDTFEFQNYSNTLAANLKYILIINSSMAYINKMSKTEVINNDKSLNLNPAIDDVKEELKKIKIEIAKSRAVVKEINKRKIAPGDLIKPKEKVQKRISKKIIFVTAVIIIVIISVKLQSK